MATLDPTLTKRLLNDFAWEDLFNELGWSDPRRSGLRPLTLDALGETYTLTPVAELGGFVAFGVSSPDGRIPDQKAREALHRAAEGRYREHVLLFVDNERGHTIWSYPVYDGKKLTAARPHHFVKGQPADLFLSKLADLLFDLSDLDDAGTAQLVDVKARVRSALDVDVVTKKFYHAFRDRQEALATTDIRGIDIERTRRHFASVLLTRLMFVFFLQKKRFLDGGDVDYLGRKLREHQGAVRSGATSDTFYRRFLRPLFFEGFARRAAERSDETNRLLGRIRYLNGGLFLEHPIEEDYPDVDVPDDAIKGILDVFGDFSWHLDDAPGGQADEINPDVLGYILEKYVNQKAFGAYYTPPEITGYLCDATVDRYLVEAVQDDAVGLRPFASLPDLLTRLDDKLAPRLLAALRSLSILDPAVGSGAFLVAALKKLLTVYQALLGYATLTKDANLKTWLAEAQSHRSTGYFLKREIITRNLFGVDLMAEATEIAKLRLFLALVASAETEADLEPLPNIDFNLLPGNSLIGLLDVGDGAFETVGKGGQAGNLFAASEFRQKLDQKDGLVDDYRFAAERLNPGDESGALLEIRDEIYAARRTAQTTLDGLIRDEMKGLGIKVEQMAWSGTKATKTNRDVALADVAALAPFHWAYEFSRVIAPPERGGRGGFDVIVTNPPWDVLKPNDKEFFERRSDAVTKNTMRIEDFVAHRAAFLAEHQDVQAEYEAYLTSFPHQSAYVRASPAYAHQTAVVGGRKTGSDLNLYKLFLERCHRLLRPDGHCGIVIPSGIYTDLGARGLRGMLFDEARVTALFGFENRRGVFEDVDSRFKFVVLTFEKGGTTNRFPAAFMRHDVADLARFPSEGSVVLDVERIRRLSPEAWSLMEFGSDTDRAIAETMAAHPALGDVVDGAWQIRLTSGFHMTSDAKALPFRTENAPGRLPLYEGKMMHQFTAAFAEPRYWVDEAAGRSSLLGRTADQGQTIDYQTARLAFRDVARNTDERTMIATVLPPNVFAGNTLPTARVSDADGERVLGEDVQLYLCAVLDSFTFDWLLRLKVTNHCNFFYVYSQPVPRLTADDPRFRPLVERAARLVCTTPAFDALAASVGLGSHANGATEPSERARLRAEIDGLVAHLYGLTEAEFAHVLGTFPLVAAPIKTAAQNAYRDVERGLIESGRVTDDEAAARAVAKGEGPRVEFKSTLRRALALGVPDAVIEGAVLKTLAAFLNTDGGTLLVGVSDTGRPLGLAHDGFASEDSLLLHLKNLVNARLGPLAWQALEASVVWLGGARVLKVTAGRSASPVYARDKGGTEALYIRTGPATTALSASETVSYVNAHFSEA